METRGARSNNEPVTDSQSGISVIVPVRNGERTIGQCVDALLSQHDPHKSIEVIVIDNASSDRTTEILRNYGDRIILCGESTPGASAARNTGIRRARYDLIAFTDADCVPRPSWLQELVRFADERPQAEFIGGRICAGSTTTGIARFAETIFDQKDAIETCKPPYVITANVLIRKAVFETMGTFNENFPRGQDCELSFRAHFHHGFTFEYCDAAAVEHFNVETLAGLLHKGFQHGTGSAGIWKEFAVELNCSRRKRIRDLGPFRDFIYQIAVLPKKLLDSRSHSRARAQALHPFYSAVFKLGRQFGFIIGTVTDRAGELRAS